MIYAPHLSGRRHYQLDVAFREAENVLLDGRLFFIDKDDFNHFKKLLERDIESNANLRDLFSSKSPWENQARQLKFLISIKQTIFHQVS